MDEKHLKVWHDVVRNELFSDYGKLGYIIDHLPEHRRENIRVIFNDELTSAEVTIYDEQPLCCCYPDESNHGSSLDCTECHKEKTLVFTTDFYGKSPKELIDIVKDFVKHGDDGIHCNSAYAFPE